MARDTGTCSRARIEARNCSIRTLPLAPPALSTPAGGTRRPSAPTGTSLRNATHLNSRSCFVLTRIGTRVKVGLPMALGTAITVAVLATLALGSRELALKLGGTNSTWASMVWTTCAIGGATIILLFGLLMFAPLWARRGPSKPPAGHSRRSRNNLRLWRVHRATASQEVVPMNELDG